MTTATAAALRDDAQECARFVSRGVLTDASPTTRALIVQLDGDSCLCTYSVGAQALAVWQFGIATLRAMASSAPDGLEELTEREAMRREAARLFAGRRLAALRRSVQKVVVLHAEPTPLSRFVGSVVLDALYEQLHEGTLPARAGNA